MEVLLRNNKPLLAVVNLREIRQQVPELPADSTSYLEKALVLLQASNTADALPAATAFHNILKQIPLYREGIVELNGPGGAAIGFPVVSFSKQFSLQAAAHPLQNIKFQEATSVVVDGSCLTFGDIDGDGDQDAFVCGPDQLMKNDKGHFTSTSFHAPEKTKTAYFGDYNNDGNLDLLVIGESVDALYQNTGGGVFKKVLEFRGPHEGALFVDLDNDGDLDIYAFGVKGNAAYRNNGDGTFVEMAAKMQIAGNSSHAAFGDFDDDGDVDLISGSTIYTNLRQGQFQNITSASGLPTNISGPVAVGDIDNDGFLDIFINGIYRNNGQGRYRKSALNLSASEAVFLDFDNDGYLDLLTAGGKPHLYRNKGGGNFEDASLLLPSFSNIRKIAVSDYDLDGDIDLFLIDASQKIHVLRNDGGNANRWLNVALMALTTGSGKNNRNGLGSKVEVKAGDLYQMRVVTEPITHFGLGSKDAADVLRVVWNNGVPQNHFHPQTNQTIVEKQVLKGSCAFLYTWDGEKYKFVTDVLWKSALGMPLGIMAGNTTYAFSNSTDEYLKIPGSALKPKDGFYNMQMTEELWETPYLDKVRLVAVDHPGTVDIYVDEKFIPPPYPAFRIYTVSKKSPPLSAHDEKGTDLLPLLLKRDDQYAAALTPGKYQGIMQIHDLILDLGKHPVSDNIVLYLNGWLYPTDASINMAMSQSTSLKVVMPFLQVIGKNGDWQTAIPNISFPMGKDKTMILDLRGKFPSEDHRVRIRTNMEIYWDQIFFTTNERSTPLKTTTLEAVRADLHYRGFSKMFRKNLIGPPWVDYSQVDKHPKWRDLEGNYTRYGDVTPLLKESDDMYVIFNSGDEITLRFDEKMTPDLPAGWIRDFLIYCDGWMKDGDLNTAYGKTVDLLPFRGMKSYPYGPDQSYPQDAAHKQYLKTYNTRKVSPHISASLR